MSQRAKNVYKAKVALHCELYEEMLDAVKKLGKMNIELTEGERKLLSIAFKHELYARRSSLKALWKVEKKDKGDRHKLATIKTFRTNLEQEIRSICNNIQSLVSKHLLPNAVTDESKVFCYKLQGDFYRYLAEIASGRERVGAANKGVAAYRAARKTADTLPPAHPLRLGVALNSSVFYDDIMRSPQRSFQIAKEAFNIAIRHLNATPAEKDRQTMMAMDLLKDNVRAWAAYGKPKAGPSNQQEDEDEEDEESEDE